jgi:hypothetical protein
MFIVELRVWGSPMIAAVIRFVSRAALGADPTLGGTAGSVGVQATAAKKSARARTVHCFVRMRFSCMGQLTLLTSVWVGSAQSV